MDVPGGTRRWAGEFPVGVPCCVGLEGWSKDGTDGAGAAEDDDDPLATAFPRSSSSLRVTSGCRLRSEVL